MPIKKQIYFEIFNKQGKDFIKMWNGKHKKEEIARCFNMSIPTVKRLRRRLKLIPKNDYKNHPYQKKLNKRIKKLYYKGYSTISISKIKKICDESVRRRLKHMNVNLRGRHERNVLYNSYTAGAKHNHSPNFLRKIIKELYGDGTPVKYIAEQIGIDKCSVIRRIKAMNLTVRIGGQAHIKKTTGGLLPSNEENLIIDKTHIRNL